ncbi:proline-rich family protein [Striga asiatica]|uniref:Proline-rich family protein n=1 Tax=Striga asiatica TaxID=4170 RepID=A0A5A7P244_STRAF|nr:proline-rich family protein [Striga asiatica]
MVMREVDEDLAIFLGMRSAVERNDPPAPVKPDDDFNKSKDSKPKPNCLLPVNATREHSVPIAAEKHDYNRQPDSSSLDPVEANETPKESNPPSEQNRPSPTNTTPSFGPNKRPLSSSSSLSGPHHKPSPRPSTPTSRPTKPRPSRGPTLPSFPSKPSSRSSTPNPSRPTRGKPVPARPASASRGRVSRPEEKPNKRQQKSCSPPKMRAPAQIAGRQRARVGNNDGNEVNPVLMGAKMVDRVVNMRKLAPPKQDGSFSRDNYGSRKSGLENSGFGRSLSKKSLDMAIRHMMYLCTLCSLFMMRLRISYSLCRIGVV